MTKKIAFINEKGGVGKTTAIFQIAGCLSSMGEKVLVIDLDKQKNISELFLSEEECDYDMLTHSPTVLDFLKGKKSAKEVVMGSYIRNKANSKPRYRNIDVMPSDSRLSDTRHLKNINVADRLNEFLEEGGYTYCLIDMPPSNKKITDICFEQMADYLLVPCTSDSSSMTGYSDLMKDMDNARIHNPNLEILGFFLSDYSPTGHDNYLKNVFSQKYGREFIDVQIPHSSHVKESRMFLRPLVYYKRNSIARASYEELTVEIMYRIEEKM